MFSVIAQAKEYGCRPSEIVGIDCKYTAYCFDEAANYIICQIKDKKTPKFDSEEKSRNQPHYGSLSEMYASMSHLNLRS